MTCVDKRHLGHRGGGGGGGNMLHHRFPNGFTEMLMDETDREVSSLTDRAFRSLCVGDEAVYNDECCYGYSPFSCHKPLVEEPMKKTHKEGSGKKQPQTNGAGDPQLRRQKKEMSSTVSSLLKAFSVAEDSGEGALMKNGYSWDKSALLSIQQELSSDYHGNLSDKHLNDTKNSREGTAKKSGKDGSQLSGKSAKSKNVKSSSKLRKLNIKNLFLHSEFSPFQSWRDLNKFPFGQEGIVTSILPSDSLPKWYDSLLYKELTEAHRIEVLQTKDPELCQKAASVEPTQPLPPPPSPLPPPPPPPRVPPKVLPKPSSAVPPENRCSSEGGETGAPWRRNRARAKSAIPDNQPGILSPPHDGSKDIRQLPGKKEVTSVEVKAVEEPGSLASTPLAFNITQLMTPVIPSRQPTETSEILQTVFSPSALDLPLRPNSEAKVTPEPPVKRESYRSIASSLLFNLKDNRKRVKSRYSPPKFKTTEISDRSRQSPMLDLTLDSPASGVSTPAILKDGQTICSPVSESANAQTVGLKKYLEPDRPISDDYLISNLLQTKKDTTGSRSLNDPQENGLYVGSPFTNSKMNKSPLVNKQSYPSLNLYKKASPETDMKTWNKDTLSVVNKDLPTIQNKGLSPNVPDNTTMPVKDIVEIKEVKDNRDKTTMDIIRAAKEAINAAKNKALSSTLSDSIKKPGKDVVELWVKDADDQAVNTKELVRNNSDVVSPEQKNRTELEVLAMTKNTRHEPPPVAKRTNTKPPEKCHTQDGLTNGDAGRDMSKENETVKKQGRFKHIFSSRQNNYIKSQRYAITEDGEEGEDEDYENGEEDADLNKEAKYPEVTAPREKKDGEHIISDLHALKELERARLEDCLLKDNEYMKNMISGKNVDEETKVKNDLISRELRNIKRGMLLMRGNIAAKREVFAKKEPEQSKLEAFAKIDSNVVVNKSRINDNYDKAKMALEEIISERAERLKNKGSNQEEQERIWVSVEQPVCDTYAVRVQERKQARQDAVRTVEDRHNAAGPSALREEVRERLGDLRDRNHMQQILSQTEIKHDDSLKPVARARDTGVDQVNTELNKMSTNRSSSNKEEQGKSNIRGENEGRLNEKEIFKLMIGDGDNDCLANVSRQAFVETKENKSRERRDSKSEVPPVPPRIKKGVGKKEGSSEREIESEGFEDVLQDSMKESQELQRSFERRQTSAQDRKFTVAMEKDTTQNANCSIKRMNSKMQEITANAETDEQSVTEQSKAEHHSTTPQEQPKIKRKAPLRPDEKPSNTVALLNEERATTKDKTPENAQRAAQNQTTEESDKTNIISQDTAAIKDEAVHDIELHGETVSPLLLNGSAFSQSPPDHSSLSSKSSYFSVESTLHRNTDSTIYNSLENLIGEVDEDIESVSRNVAEDLEKSAGELYSMSDHESEPGGEDSTTMSPTQRGEREMSSQEDSEPSGARKVNKRCLWSHVVKKNDNQTSTVQTLSEGIDCSPTNNHTPNVQSPSGSNVCSPINNQTPNVQSPSVNNVCSPTNNQTPNVQSPSGSNICSSTNNQTPNVQSPSVSNVCSPTNNQTPNVQSPSGSSVCSPTNNQTPNVQSPSGNNVASPTSHQTANVQSQPGSSVCSPTNNQTANVQSLPGSNVCSPTYNHTASVQSPSVNNVWSPSNNQTANVQSLPGSNVCSPTYNHTASVQSPSVNNVWSPSNNQTANVQSPSCSNVASPTSHQTVNVRSASSSNVSSPTIEKPSLFKVKDNTSINKKPVLHQHSFDPVGKLLLLRESRNCSERGEEDTLKYPKESVEMFSNTTTTPEKLSKKPEETLEPIHHTTQSPLSPSNLATDNLKAGQYGALLTVPQEDDRHSGVSRSSEGVESTADMADAETHSSTAATEDTEGRGSKPPSERSGSVCSGIDPQVPNKPPVVPPKSEKALLRAMKLTTRRIQKEEAKSKPAKSKTSRSSSKHRSDKSKNEKRESGSEAGSSGGEKHSSGNKSHRDGTEHDGHSGVKHHHVRSEHSSHGSERHRHERAEQGRQSREPTEKVHHGSSAERHGRSSEKLSREKMEQRYHSSDRVISDVPVYKTHSTVDNNKQHPHRSQSNDRYIVDRAEYRLRGYEKPVSDRTEPRSQQIGSIIEEPQRGRARDRPGRDRPPQRSHSIDTHPAEAADLPPHHSNSLSRQSSYTGQLSRQSSIEHAIITQSFPMTQRKLLQDPDSGQYFVVDMPIQVQTKTFFDPETGTYVQLPVQPPEGAVPQASTMEVLNTPLVLYHGFVPVPVSSMPAQKSMVQASQQEQEWYEERLARARQGEHSEDGHPYLEPVYGAQDHMLGEFLGTEELDCVS